ncbi:MAG: hypothetical protein ACRDHF_08725 [Tepidiformaceae bacterium]
MKISTVGVSATAMLAVAIVGASIVLADTANTGTLRRLYDFPHGDKVGHVLLYGTVTLLVDLALVRAFPERDPRAVALWTAITIAVLLALEELSQVWASLPLRGPGGPAGKLSGSGTGRLCRPSVSAVRARPCDV